MFERMSGIEDREEEEEESCINLQIVSYSPTILPSSEEGGGYAGITIIFGNPVLGSCLVVRRLCESAPPANHFPP